MVGWSLQPSLLGKCLDGVSWFDGEAFERYRGLWLRKLGLRSFRYVRPRRGLVDATTFRPKIDHHCATILSSSVMLEEADLLHSTRSASVPIISWSTRKKRKRWYRDAAPRKLWLLTSPVCAVRHCLFSMNTPRRWTTDQASRGSSPPSGECLKICVLTDVPSCGLVQMMIDGTKSKTPSQLKRLGIRWENYWVNDIAPVPRGRKGSGFSHSYKEEVILLHYDKGIKKIQPRLLPSPFEFSGLWCREDTDQSWNLSRLLSLDFSSPRSKPSKQVVDAPKDVILVDFETSRRNYLVKCICVIHFRNDSGW